MNVKPSFNKKRNTAFFGILVLLTINAVVCSIVSNIRLLEDIRKDANYEDSMANDTYDEYLEEKYARAVELVNNIILIRKKVEKLNTEQYIFNVEKFSRVKAMQFIIVIQVQNQTLLLKSLLTSLQKVVGIKKSLLIFCHDSYDSNINNIVHNISFAKYMQIFYPFSNQLYPKKFPGSDKMFCSGDFNCTNVTPCLESTCFRKYVLVQRKHFWWWSMNFVFDHLKVTKLHQGPIVFLEENQYVLDDLLFMLKVLGILMPDSCPQCELISFGHHTPELPQYTISNSKVLVEFWDPTHLNIGLAFNQTVWNSIKNNSYHFCHFNDYRWDASLYYMASQRPQGPFVMLNSNAPRTLQIKLCDTSDYNCTLEKSIQNVQEFAKSVHKELFPRNLVMDYNYSRQPDILTAAGEWEDVRDPSLCMYISEMDS